MSDNEIIQIVDHYLCINNGVTFQIGNILKKVTYLSLLDYQIRDIWYNTSTATLVSPEPNMSTDVLVCNGDVFDKWESIVGNSIQYTWGIIGIDKVIESIEYKNGANTILTKQFTYDADNDVASITIS